jgi:Zn-dependent protease
LFSFRGIPIRIDASWIVIALLVVWSLATGLFPAWQPGLPRWTYWTMAALGALGLFGSIVAHELCHALVARRSDIPMRGITLFIFGGVAEMGAEPPSPRAELLMAAAGPLASVGIGAIAFVASSVAPTTNPIHTILLYLGTINVLLAAFNLLPAFPLDGGRILRAALWHLRHDLLGATRTASRCGTGFGFLLMGLGGVRLVVGDPIGGIWSFLIGLFLRQAAAASYEQLLVQRALQGEPVRRFMTVGPVTVRPDISLADFLESYVYRYHHKLFPVQDNGRLLGIISSDQLRGVPSAERMFRKVGGATIPLSSLATVTPDTGALQALGRMRETGRSRLLVVQDGKLAGILTVRDLLDFLALKLELGP